MTKTLTPQDTLPLAVEVAKLCGPIPDNDSNGLLEAWDAKASMLVDRISNNIVPALLANIQDEDEEDWVKDLKEEFELAQNDKDKKENFFIQRGIFLGLANRGKRYHIAHQGTWAAEQILPHEEAIAQWEKHRFSSEAWISVKAHELSPSSTKGELRTRYGIVRSFLDDQITKREGRRILQQADKLVGKAVLLYVVLRSHDDKETGDPQKHRVVRLIEELSVSPDKIVNYGANYNQPEEIASDSNSFQSEAPRRRSINERRSVSNPESNNQPLKRRRRRVARSTTPKINQAYLDLQSWAAKHDIEFSEIDEVIKELGTEKATVTQEEAESIKGAFIL